MAPTLDLNLLPLVRQHVQDHSNMPGLLMVIPPRQTARGRNTDRLIIYFTMTGNAPLADQQQEQLLSRLAQTFYKTPGSVTNALRTTAESMNQFLLDRNLRSSSSGKQCIGFLSLVVMRDDRLIFAQCGPVHTFIITQQEMQDFADPQGAGRGLGLAKAILMRYYQVDLHANDLLVLASQPPATWTVQTLQSSKGQGIESFRRRLLSQAGDELNAVIIQAQPGVGKLRLLRPKPPIQMAQPGSETPDQVPQPVEEPVQPETLAAQSDQDSGPRLPAEAESTSVLPPPAAGIEQPVSSYENEYRQGPAASPDVLVSTDSPAASPLEVSRPSTAQNAEPAVANTLPEVGSPRQKRDTRPAKTREPGGKSSRFSLAPLARLFTRIGQFFRTVLVSVARLLQAVLKRLLPDESLFTIPASTMAFVAIAVAMMVATAGAMVYFQRGRAAQYQVYYGQAVQAAQQAAAQTNPVELRTSWETTIGLLNRADAYQSTEESKALRLQAQNALDSLDAIIRLDFQPAITGGLGSSAQITRIVATDTDIYLLNANGGNVLRAQLTGDGYEIDPEFTCGPNPIVGPLVDIVPLPKGNSLKATIVGMDTAGNFLYCIPGDLPTANSPAPPQTGWGAPKAFTLDSGDFYVLDPQTNGIWIYRNMDTTMQPHLFFGQQIPPMQDAIDLVVNREDLYLLNADGHLTLCIYSGLQESPTRCDDPVTYIDTRPGRQNGPQILDARFSQILYTPPPDPSIYMLDPANQAIYHFSLKLTLQRQFRSANSLPSSNATAFAVGPNHTIFMALGNQVFAAPLP